MTQPLFLPCPLCYSPPFPVLLNTSSWYFMVPCTQHNFWVFYGTDLLIIISWYILVFGIWYPAWPRLQTWPQPNICYPLIPWCCSNTGLVFPSDIIWYFLIFQVEKGQEFCSFFTMIIGNAENSSLCQEMQKPPMVIMEVVMMIVKMMMVMMIVQFWLELDLRCWRCTHCHNRLLPRDDWIAL